MPKKAAKKTASVTAEKVETTEKPRDTIPGYSGSTLEGTPPAAKIKTELPEGTVIGESGEATPPPAISHSEVVFKEPTKDERFVGKILCEGDTFHGYHYKQIIEFHTAVTLEGAFHAFHSHHPDAIQEGFKAKAISDEDAKKLAQEWEDKRNKA